jgi:hypothetical protein
VYQPPQVIAEKLLDFLRTASDDGQKAEVAKRIGELAERFAPDTQWFIDTMNQAGSARWSGVQSGVLLAKQLVCRSGTRAKQTPRFIMSTACQTSVGRWSCQTTHRSAYAIL